jgi:hypothetical protein
MPLDLTNYATFAHDCNCKLVHEAAPTRQCGFNNGARIETAFTSDELEALQHTEHSTATLVT